MTTATYNKATATTHASNADRRVCGRSYTPIKRGVDLVAGTVGLLLAAPLLAICALWIKVTDGGPVFYRQWRVGHGGWLFRLYKLRTMAIDAEKSGEAVFASENDPRLLLGGSWMRKSHIDELPQFWNILRGQMSLVGPRPERPEIHEWLRQSIPKLERRLEGKPGLTGLAQVRNGYTNDLSGARRKVAYDLRYLRRRSGLADLRVLLATIPKVWDQTAI